MAKLPKLKALTDQVIIIIEEMERTTKSGILLSDPEFHALPKWGEIYAIGKGVAVFKVGQRVLFREQKPKGFRFNGLKLLRIYKEQIIGLYE